MAAHAPPIPSIGLTPALRRRVLMGVTSGGGRLVYLRRRVLMGVTSGGGALMGVTSGGGC